uniref:Uncharacterized protein n=1 Tax=Panagrolaimus superbus TaxID=310955 RepID=A0A914Y4T6_9BILA
MAWNLKDKQAQYDKCMAQSAQYKFQCPSRCLAHSLLHRLLKKLGEHHFLALLVEPKMLEEPDPRLEKIIQAQNNHKLNTPPPHKRPSNVRNGYHNNNATKKPRNSIPQMPAPREFRSNGFSSSRSSSTASTSTLHASRSTSFSSSTTSLPGHRSIAPKPPLIKSQPKLSPTKSSQPCLIDQVINPAIVKKREFCNLKLQNNGFSSYFVKENSKNSIPLLPPGNYVLSQSELGVSKIEFNIEKTEKEQKLCLNIHRYGKKKFNVFGMAFRDVSGRWQHTTANKLPDDRVVSVLIPFHNATTRLAIFSVWFKENFDSSAVMGAPIMMDLFGCETGVKYVATFEPDIVLID